MIKRLLIVTSALTILFGLPLSGSGAVPVVRSWYNLTGFGNATTGGGVIPETDPSYVKVTNALGFANALQSAYKTNGSVKVIEIMNDLSLGWNEVGSAVQAVGPFRENNPPLLHPVLLNTGESLIDIKPRGGLTIFSANGATIKHCNFNIKSCTNIIVRNLKFDENWEWDENTKGQYDRNDWDFITVGNGGAVSNLWIDHCTFTKSYDGVVDQKAGVSHVTFSWNKYVGDDGATNPNSWVWQQINALESNKSNYAMYNFLRTNGYSTTDIVQIMQAHDKTHLAGQSDLDSNNATLSMTFHHQLVEGVWDRCMPRLRAGNAHDYNIYVDDTSVLAAKHLRDAVADAMTPASWTNLNNNYSFNPPVNGSISTENGAVLVEKSVYIDCLWPLRNNQTDTNNPAYTGKIMALDSIYHMDVVGGSATNYQGDSTNTLGFSCFGPAQASTNGFAFSWNTTNGQLPYTYTMHDPSQLHDILTSPTAGAGAGVLTWDKTNWLATTYPDTAPMIDVNPLSQSVTNGQTNVTLNVTAYGSLPLWYQWCFNTNSPVAGGTNMTLTITNVQPSDIGTYSVIVSNSVGPVTSAYATLTSAGGGSSPTASFTASPTSGTEPLTVTFTDASSGSPTGLFWDLGDNTTTNTAAGANFTHAYPAGTFTVTLTASNSVGTSTLVSNNVINVLTAFQSWQLQYFNSTNCALCGGDADFDGDGISNTNEFLAGTDPTSALSGLRIISATQTGNSMLITWTTAGGRTNAVQACNGDSTGSYTTNFLDITAPPHIIIGGSGDVTTNYIDEGGATNSPARFYRIRLVP